MAAGALWLLILPGRGRETEKTPPKESPWRRLIGKWHFLLMWGLLIGYVFLLPIFGFLISSAVLLAAFFFLLGERHWYLGIFIALVFTIGIYLAFSKGVQIRLPSGILEGILR